MQTAVVIMSKIPQPGFTKTRLNAVLSEQESVDFHRACLLDTCRAIVKSKLSGYIYYLPPNDNDLSGGDISWAGDRLGLPIRERGYFRLRPQQGADLGERLHHASTEILRSYEAIILLGSDIPGISSEIILEAKSQLLSHDTVIGPARDGGYYLIAIKKGNADLFGDIPWGTNRVLDKTMTAAERKQLSWFLLPVQSDIDTWRDLLDFYHAGAEDQYCRNLAAYELADRLVARYGSDREGERRFE